MNSEMTLSARPDRAAITDVSASSVWLIASVFCGVAIALWLSVSLFADPFTVQEDARSFVFWMYRWADPALFAGDPIADYFQSVTPWLYTLTYRAFFALGVDPVMLTRILPIPLTAMATIFIYLLTVRLCAAPAAGFLATLFLNLNLWMKDDLTSGTPRAFFVPVMALFLYALLRRRIVGVGLAMVLMGGVYPAGVLIMVATLGCWMGLALLRRQADRGDWLLTFVGMAIGGLMLGIFALAAGQNGEAISADLARSWSEFHASGRTRFFFDDPWIYYVCSPRSGLVPVEWCRYLNEGAMRLPFELVSLVLLILVAAVPLLLWRLVPRTAVNEPRAWLVLPAFLIGSTLLFVAAHAVLFELHLPARYSQHTLRMLAAIGFGIGSVAFARHLIGCWRSGRFASPPDAVIAGLLTLLLPSAVLAGPLLFDDIPINIKHHYPEPLALHEYLALQPKDILVASLVRETDDIPLFAKRRVLFSHEHSIPYHPSYYGPMRENILGFIDALYSENLRPMQDFVARHGVSHLVVHAATFTEDYARHAWWARQFPEAGAAVLDKLKAGRAPAFAAMSGRCVRAHYGNLVVLGARCVAGLAANAARR